MASKRRNFGGSYGYSIRHMKDKQAELRELNIDFIEFGPQWPEHPQYSVPSSNHNNDNNNNNNNNNHQDVVAITPSKYAGNKYELTASQQQEYNALEKANVLKKIELEMNTSEGRRRWQDVDVNSFVDKMYPNNNTNHQNRPTQCSQQGSGVENSNTF